MSSNVLELVNVYSSYSEVEILKGVDLEIQSGKIVALLGRNGMGKSTIIKSICGLVRPTSGDVLFNDLSILGKPSFKIANLGIGLVPEGRRIFSNLTVIENLKGSARKGYWNLPRILQLFPGFEGRLSQSASTLSGGEQQMLSIARALMTNPTLILLDEATEGLSPVVAQKIWDVLKSISKEGISILIVDKFSDSLSKFAEEGYIIERGEMRWNGNMLCISKEIIQRYLGV